MDIIAPKVKYSGTPHYIVDDLINQEDPCRQLDNDMQVVVNLPVALGASGEEDACIKLN